MQSKSLCESLCECNGSVECGNDGHGQKRHTCGGRGPGTSRFAKNWIPACAGMTARVPRLTEGLRRLWWKIWKDEFPLIPAFSLQGRRSGTSPSPRPSPPNGEREIVARCAPTPGSPNPFLGSRTPGYVLLNKFGQGDDMVECRRRGSCSGPKGDAPAKSPSIEFNPRLREDRLFRLSLCKSLIKTN